LGDVEALHARGHVAPELVGREVADEIDPGATFEQVLPGRGHVVAERRDGAEAGDDDAPSHAHVARAAAVASRTSARAESAALWAASISCLPTPKCFRMGM